jgi:hypothetical protein
MRPTTYSGLECDVCEQTFDDLDDLKGHVDEDGEPCEGAIPA